MDDLFTVEFKTRPSKEVKKEESLESPLPVKSEKTTPPFPLFADLDEAILQESEFPERLNLHLQDIRDALALEDFPKALAILDLMEELFDLELY